ncbi:MULTISPECIES: hypothetical protein [Nesterenkonia]|uniref:hypothetical protein n=1 Tax=Nesterenkonia TaxID=57494 RepID=UPI0011B53AB2|nr:MULTISPECIES: hypothetical protein [Nesterenkonia]
MTADASLGDTLGDALVAYQAGRAGFELPAPVDAVTRSLDIEGLRHAERVGEELPRIAQDHGATLSVHGVDQVTGELRATAKGSPDVLAALAELLMAGHLADDRAAAVNFSKGTHVV